MKRIFSMILFATTILSTASECLEHNYTINNTLFVWPERNNSDKWIATNCMDIEKQLIFRQCLNNDWTPSNIDFQNKCVFENKELLSNDCPYHFKPIKLQGSLPKTICVREKGLQYSYVTDGSLCVQDNIITVDLNEEEQTEFISLLSQEFRHLNSLFVLHARRRYPAKEISKNIDYKKEDVELHDVRCGRYELQLMFNSTVHVHCNEDTCPNMCLYLNATTYPFSQMIDTCSEYLIAKPKNTFLHSTGCQHGYYRTEYDYVQTGFNYCFMIKIFDEPIPVEQVENAKVIDHHCNGRIMPLSFGDDLFVFRQLADRIGLTEGHHCLFGLGSNVLIQHSYWDSSYASKINLSNFNWDKEMNYSDIIATGAISYLTVKPNGQWTWATHSVSCIVCMDIDEVPDAELQLNYNILERKLVLDVKYPDFFIKDKSSDLGFICFSLYLGVFRTNLTLSPIGYGKYLVEDVGIGQYWCSGHNVINRRWRWTGERIFCYGIWFSFEIERTCASNCSFSFNDLTQFTEFFKQKNGHVYVRDSTIVEHGQPYSNTSYTFTALLSLTLHVPVPNNLVTNFMNLTDYQLQTAYIYNEMSKESSYVDSTIKSIRSTEFCLHESPIDAIIWRSARIGETVSISSLCPSAHENELAITRTCYGDSVNGSYWGNAKNAPPCHSLVSESLLTFFNEFTYSTQATAIESLESLLQDNYLILMPLDVFLTSRILLKIVDVTFSDIQNIFSIYGSLMKINDNFLAISASANSTSVLLETLNNILLDHFETSLSDNGEFQDYGNFSINSPLIKTFIFDLNNSDASGIALYGSRNSSSDDDFTKYSLRFIYPYETVDDLMADNITDKNLVVGAYIPSDSLTFLQNTTVAMTVFFNDKLFQSTELLPENEFFKSNGKIISIKFLGLEDHPNLPAKIPIFFEANQNANFTCGHWNLVSWSSSGCNLKEIFASEFQRLALCECTHPSYFGYLMRSKRNELEDHDHTLPIIKVVASSFSLFSTLGIFITAALSKKWRKQLSSRILINLSVAITLEMCLMIFINLDQHLPSFRESDTIACTILGSILHYSILVVFFWMLIFLYLHLKRYVAVFNFQVSHLLLKSIIFGWVVPLLPVSTILIVDHSLYLSENSGHQMCYQTGWILYLGVVAPIALISLIGATGFMSISISGHRESKMSNSITEPTEFRLTLTQILSNAFMFIIMGLTGIFGFLSKITSGSYSMFSIIYCVTATIQGVTLFLNFFVFDITVPNLWLRYVRKVFNYLQVIYLIYLFEFNVWHENSK